MKEFEKNIKKESKKILENLEFECKKIVKDKDGQGISVLLKDKNSDFECWFNCWAYMEEIYTDWNKYIFNINNSKDLLQKYIQEDENAFVKADSIACEEFQKILENNLK